MKTNILTFQNQKPNLNLKKKQNFVKFYPEKPKFWQKIMIYILTLCPIALGMLLTSW